MIAGRRGTIRTIPGGDEAGHIGGNQTATPRGVETRGAPE